MFVVYLLHDGAGAVLSRRLFSDMELGLARQFSLLQKVPIISVLVTAVVVFVVCIVIDLCRRLVVHSTRFLMNKYL